MKPADRAPSAVPTHQPHVEGEGIQGDSPQRGCQGAAGEWGSARSQKCFPKTLFSSPRVSEVDLY